MKSKLVALGILSALVFSAPARAGDCDGDVAALRALYEVRQMLFHPSVSSYDISQRIDASLDELREPLSGGGYRWVRYVRPDNDAAVVVKKEHTVGAEFDSGDRDSFEASASHPFAVKVVVPRKRSVLKANKEVWVGELEVHYFVDGREKVMHKGINQWMSPDTSRTLDLGVIADRADASIASAARQVEKKESLVEIHFQQAQSQDDPENPAYNAIQSLKRVASASDPVTLDFEIARFEKRLFPTLTSTPYSTLMVHLREAEKLLASSKTEEQEKGRKMVTQISKSVGQ